jgi:ribosomal protein S21
MQQRTAALCWRLRQLSDVLVNNSTSQVSQALQLSSVARQASAASAWPAHTSPVRAAALMAAPCSAGASYAGHTRGMAVVVDVHRNNVDRACLNMAKHFREAGMTDELRKREYRRTTSEIKFATNRSVYNKRMGFLIADRLKWVVRRRKLKM